jgi:hypothetical protein
MGILMKENLKHSFYFLFGQKEATTSTLCFHAIISAVARIEAAEDSCLVDFGLKDMFLDGDGNLVVINGRALTLKKDNNYQLDIMECPLWCLAKVGTVLPKAQLKTYIQAQLLLLGLFGLAGVDDDDKTFFEFFE